jgi:uncharacterized protein DUF1579
MKHPVLLAGCALFVWAGAALAQPGGMPKPGPEVKKLGYFVGTWNTEGDMKASPFGPGGKITSTDHIEWLPGNFFIVAHSQGKGPVGPLQQLFVMGYNAEDKLYTYDGFDNMGMHDSSKGTLTGDTWVYGNESKVQGKTIKGRFTMKQVSASLYTFKFEMSGDGAKWDLIMEGKSTKTK